MQSAGLIVLKSVGGGDQEGREVVGREGEKATEAAGHLILLSCLSATVRFLYFRQIDDSLPVCHHVF